jgi:hypothetical protein
MLLFIVEISGSHGGEYEDVLWDVAPCSLIEVYQRFRGTCCLHHQGDELCPAEYYDTDVPTTFTGFTCKVVDQM